MIYNAKVFNDMGHININIYPNVSNSYDITRFINSKIRNKIDYATLISDRGATFYILKPGFENQWSYIFNNDTINLTYELDNFNPTTMIYC
uniref:Uncharacterized protein n=1 Tax=viral metagenome TaxID=1070528 RepID=A0A6C0E7Z1_9ZZZZ